MFSFGSRSSSTDLPIEVLVHASLEALNFPETFEAGVDGILFQLILATPTQTLTRFNFITYLFSSLLF